MLNTIIHYQAITCGTSSPHVCSIVTWCFLIICQEKLFYHILSQSRLFLCNKYICFSYTVCGVKFYLFLVAKNFTAGKSSNDSQLVVRKIAARNSCQGKFIVEKFYRKGSLVKAWFEKVNFHWNRSKKLLI